MLDGVFVKNYTAPTVNDVEIFRYAGQKGEADGRLKRLLDECLQEALPALSYRVCYAVGKAEEVLASLDEEGKSRLVKARLCKAEYAVVFGATVGLEIDRLIVRYGALSPTKALLFQAIGAERIESLCDTFCKDLKAEWKKRDLAIGARFSAGYGDFPLSAQKQIFALLSPERNIGLTLNGSLLMTPTKSVTAIVPIGKTETPFGSCEDCPLRECAMRKKD